MKPIPQLGMVYSAPVPHYHITKEIELDSIPAQLHKQFYDWWDTNLPLTDAAQQFSEQAFRSLPFLGFPNYDAYAERSFDKVMKTRKEFFSLFSRPRQLSWLLENKYADCTVYALALGLAFEWPVYHKYDFSQKEKKPSRHAVAVANRDLEETIIVDPVNGHEMPSEWFREQNDMFDRRYFPVTLLEVESDVTK